MDEAFADLETSMRSRTCTPAPDNFRFSSESARYNMESQPRSVIDFSLPTITPSTEGGENSSELSCPISWSSQNILAFPRGNRIYLKNITSTVEDVGYTFKPSKKHGILRMLDFCRDAPNLLALGTSTDNIELWDIDAKKMTRSWTATGITCLEWNEGRVLTVGDKKGSIQYYDTRIDDRKEMKMKKGKVTRHEAPMTTISWNRKDPKYLASGDKDGVIYYWDSRQDAPLKMGEMVQRRRKMQHDHAVSVMGWCNSRVLATAANAPDNTSVLRLWTMDDYSENIERHEYDATIVGVHASWCREIVLTHGPGKVTSHPSNLAAPVPSAIENSVVAYALPYFKQAKQVKYLDSGSRNLGSVLDRTGTRVVVAVSGADGGAAASQLQVCDVWGKKTAPALAPPSVHGGLVRRQNSLSSLSRRGSLIIR